MKVHKIELYIVDYNNENYDIESEIENEYRGFWDNVGVKCKTNEVIEISEEEFDNGINLQGTTIEDYRKLFNKRLESE